MVIRFGLGFIALLTLLACTPSDSNSDDTSDRSPFGYEFA